jgi:hypothetical protein
MSGHSSSEQLDSPHEHVVIEQNLPIEETRSTHANLSKCKDSVSIMPGGQLLHQLAKSCAVDTIIAILSCKMCKRGPCTDMALPCAHLSLCSKCKLEANNCPMCDTPLESTQTVLFCEQWIDIDSMGMCDEQDKDENYRKIMEYQGSQPTTQLSDLLEMI